MGRKCGPLLMALAALGLWGSARMTWIEATADDDKSGTATLPMTGAVWSLELTAIALLLLAGVIAGLALRRGARRIIGIVVALASAGVAWRPVELLTYGADVARAQQLLQAGDANSTAVDTVSISSWATITEAAVHSAGPLLALAAASLGLVGGVLLAMRPGVDGARSNRYETKAARRAKLAEDLETSQDSGRVMWDALDDDIDPTDP